MRIWWERKPDMFRTIYFTFHDLNEKNLVHNGKMTILPGQKFTMDFLWDIHDDNGVNLIGSMNFARISQRHCSPNVVCADPETFMIEASLNLFDRLGYVVAEPKEFDFIAKSCIYCGVPPCLPPPGGCRGD
jgi:hypothetical protein